MIGSQLKSDIANEFTLEKFDDGLKFYKANMSLGKTLIRPAFGHWDLYTPIKKIIEKIKKFFFKYFYEIWKYKWINI